MRRLFSTFAHGPPGAGLLLLRLAGGVALVVPGIQALLARPPLGLALFQAFSIGFGALLLAGLWTPIVGALITVEALWKIFSSGHPWSWIMVAAVAAALVLIGPGAWSVDARLFGWRRLDIRERKHQDPPP